MTTQNLGQIPPPSFQQRVEGTWGQFSTASGSVSYVMTNARLGSATGSDWERRLTQHLRPVREVLDVAEMGFGQLLQRNLNDHRVAAELVPYLLKANPAGPAFFPPIMTVLLPFSGFTPSTFPSLGDPEEVDAEGLRFSQRTAGSAFCVRQLIDESGALSVHRLGQLAWNQEEAKMVVLDGQHRAMALLAIQRTITNTWGDETRGAKYRHFYERRVRDARSGISDEALASIQIPVTVCWFPDLAGESGAAAHAAARKLFIDVNREAKPPSPDRVKLLSDDDLLYIFLQATLQSLREGSTPPLFAIEYDGPGSVNAQTLRWSVVTSLEALEEVVRALVFGPLKYIENLDVVMRGRPSNDEDAVLRRQLRVAAVLGSAVTAGDGSVPSASIGRRTFPLEAKDTLIAAYASSWGAAVLALLGGLLPFRAHYQALDDISTGWQPADSGTADALAKEAIFESVGTYWALRDYDARTDRATTDSSGSADLDQAWAVLGRQQRAFIERRRVNYLDDVIADADVVDDVFDVMRTKACQLGLGLLLGHLAVLTGAQGEEIGRLGVDLTTSLNEAMKTTSANGQPRRLFLSTVAESSLNQIAYLSTARAIEFRYLWLEMLCVPVASQSLATAWPQLDEGTLATARDAARTRYASYLVDERYKTRLRLNPSVDQDRLRVAVTLEVVEKLEAALGSWFDVGSRSFKTWASTEWGVPLIDESDVDDAEGVDGDGDDEGATTSPGS